jgi:NAD(P)-dependent dehydrogenase (short-subunit alcohol dehydrogenase family)
VRDLAGRTAVVVGGGSGIGRGIALGLAGEKMHVVVADIDGGSSAQVGDEILASGGDATAATVDATDRASLSALADLTIAGHGAVHVLVTTIGVVLDRPLDQATDEDWAWFLEFNVMAQVRSVDVFLPHLRAHGEPGHIVTTSSMAGVLALPPPMVGNTHLGLYTTTKHALVGYSEMLRHELEPAGIGVSVLCPGMVASRLATTSARNRPDRFGGPLPAVEHPPPPTAIPNEEVGPYVVRGIRANRAYIFTHPDAAGLVRQRQARVQDDFSFFAGDEP